MKQAGFSYLPNLGTTERPDPAKQDAGDYDALKDHRQKYGLEIFASFVYPDDPKVNPFADESQEDPNGRIIFSLSSTQQKAYLKAKDACVTKEAERVLGKRVSSDVDLMTGPAMAFEEAARRELDGDPQLVDLAAAYGDCLAGKGYRVASTKPTEVATTVRKIFQGQLEAIRKKQDPGAEPAPKGIVLRPDLSSDQARPYFTKEIRSALDDLECGKEFYPVFGPKQTALRVRIDAEFGQ
ncbi:hypothetical protein ACFXJ8_05885 [Nonomuraea sp. NPDC059194]|uniref:hypothetical protein n=1 Tax=Nonomuraea sp. NPDC059194 TaxID=3346764 RepID=UPI0036D0586A